MARVTTNTEPNLYQLALELGDAGIGFRMVGPTEDGQYRIRSDDVSQGALAAAVAKHVPDPTVVPPEDPQVVAARERRERVRRYRQELRRLPDGVGAAALRDHVRSLTEAFHDLAQLVLGDEDQET